MRPMEKTALVLAACCVLAVAGVFRFHALSARPLHGDEANQAVKTGILYDKGEYAYDPFEHHGPTLYYLTLPLLWLSGAESFKDSDILPYRLVPAGCGLLLVALLLAFGRMTGCWAAFWAALLTAVSHAVTYYSRYYIQETSLVLFTWAAVFFAWRFLRAPGYGRAAVLGLCAGLMHATKETCLPVGLAAAGAVAATLVWNRITGGEAREEDAERKPLRGPLLLAAGVAAAVSVTFFTSFFTHARGPLDSVLTYTTYLNRAGGAGSSGIHDHPWHYYFVLWFWHWKMAGPKWTEAPVILLGLVGLAAALWPRRRGAAPAGHDLSAVRFIAFFTLAMTAGFSIIPYKAPWNMLVFYQGWLLLAGFGAAALVRRARFLPLRALAALLLLGVAGFLGHQAWLGNFRYAADVRNPYVYAHTSTALLRIADRAHQLAAVHPDGKRMVVRVIRPGGDYWPLPWYFRDLERVGYHGNLPADCNADMVISGAEIEEPLKGCLQGDYFTEMGGLRPGVPLVIRIQRPLWNTFMETRRGPAAKQEN